MFANYLYMASPLNHSKDLQIFLDTKNQSYGHFLENLQILTVAVRGGHIPIDTCLLNTPFKLAYSQAINMMIA